MNQWLNHPWEELSSLRHSLDETLKTWSTAMNHPVNAPLDWGWKPRMDVKENHGFYQIALELPGFMRDDLDVQVNGRFLSIKGCKPDQPTDDEWRYHRRERYSGGEFHRAVALPEGIDGTSIQAKFVGGVLTLTIPKSGGKSSQHVNLLGKEEHSNRRFVIDAEERERRRRMEEQDPILSRAAWQAGRMGAVIDEERERERRIAEQQGSRVKESLANLKTTKALERKEKDRRATDKKGEAEKKKIAAKVSRLIKGCAGLRASLSNTSNIKQHHVIEEKERQDRMRDQQRAKMAKNNAKKVSQIFKASAGKSELSKSPVVAKKDNQQQLKANKATKALEEKERQERLRDTRRAQMAKNNAKKVSQIVKSSGGKAKLNEHPLSVTKKENIQKTGKQLAALEEKERANRIKDKRGQQEAKKKTAVISKMIANAVRANPKKFQTSSPLPSPANTKRPSFGTKPSNASVKVAIGGPSQSQSQQQPGSPLPNNHANSKFLEKLEEKERQRRLADKKGQLNAKRNAALIAHMIGGSGNF
eukprot:gene16647-19779_t